MANFLDKLLSGKYPAVENLWRSEFSRMVDEALSSIPTDDLDESELTVERLSERLEEANDMIDKQRDEIANLRAAVSQADQRLESMVRQYETVAKDRNVLRYKLDAVQHALKSVTNG